MPANRFMSGFAVVSLGLAVLGMLPVGDLHAQSGNYDEPWRWVHFTTDDGLPSNYVTKIVESTSGTFWAATSKGVAWYDKYEWIPIDSSKGLPKLLPLSIEEDLSDSILVVVGGHLYRGNQSGFHKIPIEGVTAAIPLDEHVLLIIANDTLFSYEQSKIRRFQSVREKIGREPDAIMRTRKGDLWFGGGESLYKWDIRKSDIELLASEQHKIVWLAENKSGAGCFVLHGSWDIWDWSQGSAPTKIIQQYGDPITTIDIDPDGTILAVDKSEEIRLRRDREWLPETSFRPYVRSITFVRFRDDGDLWVCSRNGLYLYKRTSNRWSFIRDDSSDRRNIVGELLKAKDGSFWTATDGGVKVRTVDGSTRVIDRIGGQVLTSVTGLAEDIDGNVWISSGSAFKGAYRWDGTNWKYFKVADDPRGIFVHRITHDRRGRLWFLGLMNPVPERQPGAYVLDRGVFTHWGLREGLLSERVYTFAEGMDSSFWFGTLGGLHRWKSGHWTYWTRKHGMKTDVIFGVMVDQSNRTWFADRSNGLGFLDERDSIHYLTMSDGLVENSVWNAVEDDRRWIWVATEGGLSCYHDGIFSNFEFQSGLPNSNLWAILPIGDTIYVGTAGGGTARLIIDAKDLPTPRMKIEKPILEENNALVRWHVYPYWEELPTQPLLTRYRIDEQDWSQWDSRRELTASGLSSGHHIVTVQGKSTFGNYNPEGIKQSFYIPYPFYGQLVFLLPVGSMVLLVCFLGVSFVVRKRRHNRQLRKSELKFRRLTEATFEGIAIHEGGVILDANQSMLNIFGCRSDEFVGRSLLHFIVPESLDVVKENMLSESENMCEAVAMKRDESRIVIEIIGKTIPYEDRSARVVAVRDITERKRAEMQLLEYQTQLQSLASQLSLTEEKERRRMAEYLHEYIGQTLALCKIKLGKQLVPVSQKETELHLDAIRRLLDQMIESTQSLTFELSPPALYELDFEDAIEWLAEQIQDHHDLSVKFYDDGQSKPLRDEMRVLLFHAVRELLVNVVKHAGAKEATVSLFRRDSRIQVVVEDNGIGLESEVGRNHGANKEGFGLFNIRERLTYFGGKVQIDSHLGLGTRIILEAPLAQSQECSGEDGK